MNAGARKIINTVYDLWEAAQIKSYPQGASSGFCWTIGPNDATDKDALFRFSWDRDTEDGGCEIFEVIGDDIDQMVAEATDLLIRNKPTTVMSKKEIDG